MDTGNPLYKYFSVDCFDEELFDADKFFRESIHMDEVFYFFQQEVKICVRDRDGNVASRVYNIGIVEEWEDCALLQASPNRIGFVGRDLLYDLGIIILLDSKNEKTTIIEVTSDE